jgi:hypothetical protein
VKKIQIAEVEIPMTFYLFDSNHNSLILAEGATNFSIVLPVGNYSISQITTELPALLNAESPMGNTYNVSVSNGFLTVSSTGTFNISGGTMNALLGLPASSLTDTSITGSSVVQLGYPNFLFLRSNLGSLSPYDAQINNSQVSNNILARIPLNGNYGDIIFYQPTYDHLNYFMTNSYIQNISYYFTYPDINNPTNPQKDVQVQFNGGITSMKIKLFASR